jgi:glycosyltransferase involved in cell wall biosynthesis
MNRLVFYHGGNITTASYRLRVHITTEYCKKNNYPYLSIGSIDQIKNITEDDIVILCKTQTIEIINQVKKQNPHKIIYDVSDNFFYKGGNDAMKYQLAQSDAVTCTCDKLKNIIEKEQGYKKPIMVIEDSAWYDFTKPSFMEDESVLKICWYGCPRNTRHGDFNKLLFDPIRKNKEKLPRIEYHFMTDEKYMPDGYKGEDVKIYPHWSLEKQEKLVTQMDIVALPVRYKEPFLQGKGHTKLVDGLACGTMVVASPQYSYRIFEDFAFLGDNMLENITYCINNKKEVLDRIKMGQEFIRDNFSREKIARKRIQYLQQL